MPDKQFLLWLISEDEKPLPKWEAEIANNVINYAAVDAELMLSQFKVSTSANTEKFPLVSTENIKYVYGDMLEQGQWKMSTGADKFTYTYTWSTPSYDGILQDIKNAKQLCSKSAEHAAVFAQIYGAGATGADAGLQTGSILGGSGAGAHQAGPQGDGPLGQPASSPNLWRDEGNGKDYYCADPGSGPQLFLEY